MSLVQSQESLRLPTTLETQLHAFRSRLRWIKTAEAVCGAIFGVLATFVVLFAVDRVFDTADWVRGHLERYRAERNATMLIASHNMAEVERLCDRVIIMKRGKIEDDAAPDVLLTRYSRDNLEEVFLDVARGRGEAAREAAQ